MFRTSRITRLKTLTSYLWPKNNPKVKFRVVTSMSLLLAGKSLNVYVPYSFKQIIDTLSITHSSLDPSLLLVPVIAYGGARFGSTLFSELRNSVFAMVAHRAIRDASRNVLVHILNLDINFHLSRQTGSLVKSIDRGAKGINQILTALLFHIAPTAFEITLVCGILTYSYGWQYAAISLITVSSYSAFTFMTTTWRAVFRKEMNIADNQSSAIATDSLLNYEAVKHFSNESLEVSKFDKALENYEKAAIKSTTSLALLNIGQNLIFTSALTAVMYMGSNGILQGNLTIGDLVMINGLLFQLSMPLNFLGMVYRETTQAFIDMDEMFKLGSIESKIIDGDSSLVIKKGEIKFENVTFGYPGKQPILKNVSFTIPGGKSLAICGSSGIFM